jgi:hypothetical protein
MLLGTPIGVVEVQAYLIERGSIYHSSLCGSNTPLCIRYAVLEVANSHCRVKLCNQIIKILLKWKNKFKTLIITQNWLVVADFVPKSV